MAQQNENSSESFLARILVVDDDEVTCKNLRRILTKAGYCVVTHSNSARALEDLHHNSFDLLVSDLRMPYMDGLTLLDEAKRFSPQLEVILITGYATVQEAVFATKKGAFHYLSKPFTPEELRQVVGAAIEQKRLREPEPPSSFSDTNVDIIGQSPKIRHLAEVVRQIAPTDCNVMITGESGTGKELVARAIHSQSARADGPFVAFNCGAFSEELIANELFGHEKEAFTGASNRRAGLLEVANKGTLLLDEVGEMPLSMQVKLLRVIQEREVIRVGGTVPVPLDVRFIAATARNLRTAALEGSFRQDLYFRLDVVNITVPKLAERRDDIPVLAQYFLKKFSHRMNKTIHVIAQETMEVLKDYAYPGNVRELENIIERAVAVSTGEMILVRDLPPDLARFELRPYRRKSDSGWTLDEIEKDYIVRVLQFTGGNRTQAAEILGIDRTSLWRKMRKHRL
jgi:DNA-binding NtrC family response regulator